MMDTDMTIVLPDKAHDPHGFKLALEKASEQLSRGYRVYLDGCLDMSDLDGAPVNVIRHAELLRQPEPEPIANDAPVSPWVPMSDPLDVKHLGKLAEELGEASAAVARCLIQGIDEAEPVTGKVNREWLEDELADVDANIFLVIDRFGLDTARMVARRDAKIERLRVWHAMAVQP